MTTAQTQGWSTREIAELAGTTLRAVRYYHEVGLLDEPERSTNGYKQYRIGHLVVLLQIRRLVDLGVPLGDVPGVLAATQDPEEMLRALDAELAANMQRQQRMRDEIAELLRHPASKDLPPGFGDLADVLPVADRALILIYSRLFGQATMASLRGLVVASARSGCADELAVLPLSADERTRQDLAERYADDLREYFTASPWTKNSQIQASLDVAHPSHNLVAQALHSLYNPAQLDVLVLLNRILTSTASLPHAPARVETSG